mmetsp:Transcript_66804/g.209016  ORF Transcript_66804/g.209016 Transcript_66804/m.209016 type:complete len:347 (+) Transcript_66804:437-1477(+)
MELAVLGRDQRVPGVRATLDVAHEAGEWGADREKVLVQQVVLRVLLFSAGQVREGADHRGAHGKRLARVPERQEQAQAKPASGAVPCEDNALGRHAAALAEPVVAGHSILQWRRPGDAPVVQQASLDRKFGGFQVLHNPRDILEVRPAREPNVAPAVEIQDHQSLLLGSTNPAFIFEPDPGHRSRTALRHELHVDLGVAEAGHDLAHVVQVGDGLKRWLNAGVPIPREALPRPHAVDEELHEEVPALAPGGPSQPPPRNAHKGQGEVPEEEGRRPEGHLGQVPQRLQHEAEVHREPPEPMCCRQVKQHLRCPRELRRLEHGTTAMAHLHRGGRRQGGGGNLGTSVA